MNFTYICKDSALTIYSGKETTFNGGDYDKKIIEIDSTLTELEKTNQIFIEFNSDGGSKKNFSAKITFGIEQNHKKLQKDLNNNSPHLGYR